MTTTSVRAASPALAAAQGRWVAAMEPWKGLDYSAAGLGRFLRATARSGHVLVAAGGSRGRVAGVLAMTPGFLLGSFISLLAVRPESAGQGVGRALIAQAEADTFAKRRWLFVSADADNTGALRFYRKLGFTRVGRLPDLVRTGRTEILLRKARP